MLRTTLTAFAALLALTQVGQLIPRSHATTLARQDAVPAADIQSADSPETDSAPAKIEKGAIGSTKNVHQCGKLFLAGQFEPEDLQKIKSKQIKRIITLRTDGEIKWDEQAAVEEAGLKFVHVPFRSPESLTDEVFDKIRKLLKDESTKTLFHCGSANRVGGVWLPYRVLDEGVPVETAMAEAKEIGLKSPMVEKKALDYIRRKLAEQPAPDSDPNQDTE